MFLPFYFLHIHMLLFVGLIRILGLQYVTRCISFRFISWLVCFCLLGPFYTLIPSRSTMPELLYTRATWHFIHIACVKSQILKKALLGDPTLHRSKKELKKSSLNSRPTARESQFKVRGRFVYRLNNERTCAYSQVERIICATCGHSASIPASIIPCSALAIEILSIHTRVQVDVESQTLYASTTSHQHHTHH